MIKQSFYVIKANISPTPSPGEGKTAEKMLLNFLNLALIANKILITRIYLPRFATNEAKCAVLNTKQAKIPRIELQGRRASKFKWSDFTDSIRPTLKWL